MESLKTAWCRVMHHDIAYGGGDVYWCRKCLCRFPVPWVPTWQGRPDEKILLPPAAPPVGATGVSQAAHPVLS
jgi:hypothetical protein